LSNPLLLQWHNAAAVFNDPIPTHIGLALLTHQLGYFDILPLYVVLMLMAPFFALIDRIAPQLLLPISLGLYLVVLTFRITLPTWPVAGTWFFNPLAWQLVFVLGFLMAKAQSGIGALVRRHIRFLRIFAVPIIVMGVLVHGFNLWPDPTHVPNPKLLFIADKAFDTPMRLIQFLSLVTVFSGAYHYIRELAKLPFLRAPIEGLTGLLAMLGRNSLYVFCIGSLLSLMAQVARFTYRGTVATDTVVVILGVVIMAATAWIAELRERARPAQSASSAWGS
jgi:hypothetical protein